MSLIIVKHSAQRRMLNSQLFDAAADGDDLLLIQDGVLYAITEPQMLGQLKSRGVNVFVSVEDLVARGYDPDKVSFEKLDYGGIVDLIEKNPKIIS
ncbi:sulfurtransferase complex subunit TusB [Coprothermobacteraceae bacterium]|nr:sulfurtransferase complex subunit TusB [Coprothermobacteraceae bacterium]